MRVLIVDDQRSARRVVRTTLAELPDVQPIEAGSADDALRAVEEKSPDLILLDIRLSPNPLDRAGLDVLQQLRATGNSTPVVIISSITEVAEIRQAMWRGAQGYVFKDEIPQMLLPVLQNFRERVSLRREVARLRDRVDSAWAYPPSRDRRRPWTRSDERYCAWRTATLRC